MPFAATLGTVYPNRIRLFNKGIPLLALHHVQHGVLLVADMAWRALFVIEQELLREQSKREKKSETGFVSETHDKR